VLTHEAMRDRDWREYAVLRQLLESLPAGP
jgi:hypothetical protein